MSPKTKTIILEILYFPFRVLLLCWLAITWIILFLDMILPTVKGSKAERDPYNEGRYCSYNRSCCTSIVLPTEILQTQES